MRIAFLTATEGVEQVELTEPWKAAVDAVRGRVLTSWPSVATDIRNAGRTWVDEQVTVCDHGSNKLVTSRKPDDLKAFDEAFLDVFTKEAV